MLTSFADDEAFFASIMAGASDYVLNMLRDEKLARLSPRGTHPRPCRRVEDQQGDRAGGQARGEDRQELRVDHPDQAGGGSARGSGGRPGAPHDDTRSVDTLSRWRTCGTVTVATLAELIADGYMHTQLDTLFIMVIDSTVTVCSRS